MMTCRARPLVHLPAGTDRTTLQLRRRVALFNRLAGLERLTRLAGPPGPPAGELHRRLERIGSDLRAGKPGRWRAMGRLLRLVAEATGIDAKRVRNRHDDELAALAQEIAGRELARAKGEQRLGAAGRPGVAVRDRPKVGKRLERAALAGRQPGR